MTCGRMNALIRRGISAAPSPEATRHRGTRMNAVHGQERGMQVQRRRLVAAAEVDGGEQLV